MKNKRIKLLALVLACSMVFPLAAFAEEAAERQPVESQQTSESADQAANPDLAPSARSAILLDADSGTVIFEKNSHDRLPPASITKIMTLLLIMESIDEGKIKLKDMVQVSEYASSIGGSQIFLEQGEKMSVDDLIKGIALASGNDASVAMAEKIAGTEQQFVAMMNKRAKELGLNDTHFVNTNGLPAADHYSSAHDIAMMSKELLKHPEITKYTGLYQDYLRKTSEKPFWLVNTNKLVRFYSGADGLKTGYTSEAKYCLSATAKRDNLRVIAVVMGEPTTKVRNAEVSQMFDYSFAQYMNYPILKEGDSMGTLRIEKGMTSELPLTANRPYSVLLKKGTDTKEIRYELKLESPLKAPVKHEQPIGKLMIYQGDSKLKEFDVHAPQAVDKANWWKLLKRSASSLFS